jgi:organic radical activating enzyme
MVIGGEPTLHPAFPGLLRHAIGAGLAVEVYTNLTHVRDAWWELFAIPGVSLATDQASESTMCARWDAVPGLSRRTYPSYAGSAGPAA